MAPPPLEAVLGGDALYSSIAPFFPRHLRYLVAISDERPASNCSVFF